MLPALLVCPSYYLLLSLILGRLEVVLAYTTEWAYPIIGDVFEGCTGLNAAVGVACCGVINVTADAAYILFHKFGYLRVNKWVIFSTTCSGLILFMQAMSWRRQGCLP